MLNKFEVSAEPRSMQGKSASRRLRRDGKVPAILYGAGKEPVSIQVIHNEMLLRTEHEAFYSHVLTLKMAGGADEKVVLKAMQRHPVRPVILHVDFLRIDENAEIEMRVPIHFINEATCHAVKNEGGSVSHLMSEIEVLCLPKDLPEYIVVDLAEVKLGATVHLSELQLPEGVRSAVIAHGGDPMMPVVAIHAPKGADAGTPAA
jgi:large subunit ribosomal protein L25